MSEKCLDDIDVEQQPVLFDKTPGIHGGRRRSLRSWPRTPLAVAPDQEPQADSANLVRDLRHQALHRLFGLPPAHLQEWSGLLVFLYHLESCFQELLDPCFAIIWKILRREYPSTRTEVWYWCFAVIDAFESSQDPDPSIERIYQQLWKTAVEGRDSRGAMESTIGNDKRYALEAIFSILCWVSATLKPLVGTRATQVQSAHCVSHGESALSVSSVSLSAENCSLSYSSTDMRRPTSKMFHSYLNHDRAADHPAALWSDTQAPTRYNLQDELYESSLNYGSLLSIGRVRIKWVDELTAHLLFDRATRELSVYRYPSLCAAKILSQHQIGIVERIAEKLLPSQFSDTSGREKHSLYREVLLSYRFIFGQSRDSRKLIRRAINRSSDDPAKSSSQSVGGTEIMEVDTFLQTLCTSPLRASRRFLDLLFLKESVPTFQGELFPCSALDMNDRLMESDTYSARDDFPIFGLRLLSLQRYNMRRQPSKVADLWRDRRNSLQWYTFWAVIWIGGAGIILSLLQLVAGVVQMAYAIRFAN